MKITVTGTRGIPDVLGGVETHCQHLYPEIKSQYEIDICVIARAAYVPYRHSEYKGVETKAIWTPKKQSLEAIIHTTLAAFSTLFDKSDIVHVHAIGPGLLVPLLRLLGKKVVFTHHGPDYDRQKWGGFAKKVLLLGEKWATRYATEVIVISDVINNIIKEKHNRHDAHLIYNGVVKPEVLVPEVTDLALSAFNLQPQKYMVAVGRFVEEKGFHDLIAAHQRSGTKETLVIIGDSDHPSEYSEKLKAQAKAATNVVLTGFLRGDELKAIFSQARLFVMPSYHEGLPIALLEAMSFSLPAIVSNIPANLEVNLAPETYFKVGDVDELAAKIKAAQLWEQHDYTEYLKLYDWHIIAQQTMQVYQQILNNKIK